MMIGPERQHLHEDYCKFAISTKMMIGGIGGYNDCVGDDMGFQPIFSFA
jgi:hypothetical protein